MTDSQRDVVFTPFMLRMRDALTGDGGHSVLHFEPSRPTSVAFAIDEWFGLRARAEHVIAEANAMLHDSAERIELEDEFGTGHLGFSVRWRDREVRIGVSMDAPHRAHVTSDEPGWVDHDDPDGDVKPTDQDFLEDLAVSLVSLAAPELDVVDLQARDDREENPR